MNGAPLQHKVTVTNPRGFHLRPMAAFAQLASRFQSSVKVAHGDRLANGKSIFDLMQLAAPQGSQLLVEVAGPDADDALRALVALLEAPPPVEEEDSPEPPLSRT